MNTPGSASDAVVIAIDGTSGSGKSSTARGVATKLGLRYLDTGAMYRAMTWWMLEHDVDPQDSGAVAQRVDDPVIESGTDPSNPTITLDGQDVSAEIRTDVVNANVSAVSTVPELRFRLRRMQRAMIEEAVTDSGMVLEGRDIGTVVWPDAQLKLFLSADPAARATRRALEEGNQDAAQVEATRASLEARDEIDSTQGGLEVPYGAVHVDTTSLTLDEVIDEVVAMVESVRSEA